jgi:hypothetical protein
MSIVVYIRHWIWHLDCVALRKLPQKWHISPQEDKGYGCSARQSTYLPNCVTWCIEEVEESVVEVILGSGVTDLEVFCKPNLVYFTAFRI